MAKLVFDFHIQLFPDKISELKATNGEVAILPFGGSVDSELFKGTILPGAERVMKITVNANIEGDVPCIIYLDDELYSTISVALY